MFTKPYAIVVLLFTLVSASANASINPMVAEQPPATESSMHQQTYDKLVNLVADIYQQTNFNPSACDSYFNDSELSSVIAIPLIITPGDSFQFEVFGQMYDSRYQYLSHIDDNAMIYGFHYDTAVADRNLNNMALGFGVSMQLDDNVNMKTLFSSSEIPGHGNSNLAVGLEVQF